MFKAGVLSKDELKVKARQGIKQGTFDFLGFTFYLGISKNGYIIPKLKIKAKAMRTKLNRITKWIKAIRNVQPLKSIWKTFQAKIRGNIEYYGVSHNTREVSKFIHISKRSFPTSLAPRRMRDFLVEEFFNHNKSLIFHRGSIIAENI